MSQSANLPHRAHSPRRYFTRRPLDSVLFSADSLRSPTAPFGFTAPNSFYAHVPFPTPAEAHSSSPPTLEPPFRPSRHQINLWSISWLARRHWNRPSLLTEFARSKFVFRRHGHLSPPEWKSSLYQNAPD